MLHMKQPKKLDMYSQKRQFGNLGEEITVKNLISSGLTVLSRNYLKKWGEIDIVARGTDGKVHFIEVKTISNVTAAYNLKKIPHDTWRPEDNVHPEKLKRLHRVINSWLEENTYEGEWQVDIAAVSLDTELKKATIRYIENVT